LGFEGAVFVRAGGDAAVEFEGEAVALFFDAIDAGIDGVVLEPEMDFLAVGVGDGPLQSGLVGTVCDLHFVCHVEPSACLDEIRLNACMGFAFRLRAAESVGEDEAAGRSGAAVFRVGI
jgi:hypothetical protein